MKYLLALIGTTVVLTLSGTLVTLGADDDVLDCNPLTPDEKTRLLDAINGALTGLDFDFLSWNITGTVTFANLTALPNDACQGGMWTEMKFENLNAKIDYAEVAKTSSDSKNDKKWMECFERVDKGSRRWAIQRALHQKKKHIVNKFISVKNTILKIGNGIANWFRKIKKQVDDSGPPDDRSIPFGGTIKGMTMFLSLPIVENQDDEERQKSIRTDKAKAMLTLAAAGNTAATKEVAKTKGFFRRGGRRRRGTSHKGKTDPALAKKVETLRKCGYYVADLSDYIAAAVEIAALNAVKKAVLESRVRPAKPDTDPPPLTDPPVEKKGAKSIYTPTDDDVDSKPEEL